MEHVLFVCTGNVCRSPMAEAVAVSLLRQRGVDVTVGSAGLLSGDRCSTAEAQAVMRRRSLDLSGHRSRELAAALDPAPDLVLAMAREHARAVVDLQPDLFVRTFTIKDFVRRAQEENPRRSDETVDAYLARLQHDRRPWDLVGPDSADDDVFDPIGCSKRIYERVATEIEDLVGILVDRVWPARAPAATPPA